MMQTAAKPQRENEVAPQDLRELDQLLDRSASRARLWSNLRLLWLRRRFLLRSAFAGLVCATVIAFLIPKRYTSITQLMPPDSQSSGTLTLVSALAGQAGSLGAVAGDMLGLKSTGALFIGVLHSRTVEDGVIKKFDLKKIYG